VAARHAIRPIRDEEAQARGPRHAGEKRREAARARIGVVEILEREEHRLALAAPREQAVDRLVDPRRSALRRDPRPAAAEHRVAQTRPELREQAREWLGAGTDDPTELRVVDRRQPRP